MTTVGKVLKTIKTQRDFSEQKFNNVLTIMELKDLVWFLAFLLLFLALNLIQNLIENSLEDKPMGNQTIYDLAMRDVFFGMKVYGSYVCFLYMAARFEAVRQFFHSNETGQTIACAVYFFGFVTMCLKSVFLFTVRILCIIRMSFLDESVGESNLVMASNLFCMLPGISASLLLTLNGEVNSGSFKALITGEVVPSG